MFVEYRYRPIIDPEVNFKVHFYKKIVDIAIRSINK